MKLTNGHLRRRRRILTVVLLVIGLISSIGIMHAAQLTPASYWPAEEDALDVVGSNDGSLAGGARFEEGVKGLAFRFEHIGDAVVIPPNPSLDLEIMPAASFEGWIKVLGNPSVTKDMVIIAKHHCGFANGWFFTTKSGGYIAGHFVGGFGTGDANLEDGAFHHFAVVKDGTTYREYIDGELTGETIAPPVGSFVPGTTTYIGSVLSGGSAFDPCYPAKHQLNGLVDEVNIYHHALTPMEIRLIFRQTSRGAGAGNQACQASKGVVIAAADEKTSAINCTTSTPPGGGDGGGGGV